MYAFHVARRRPALAGWLWMRIAQDRDNGAYLGRPTSSGNDDDDELCLHDSQCRNQTRDFCEQRILRILA